jgi:hypothetical protein
VTSWSLVKVYDSLKNLPPALCNILKNRESWSSKILIQCYDTTWRYIPDDSMQPTLQNCHKRTLHSPDDTQSKTYLQSHTRIYQQINSQFPISNEPGPCICSMLPLDISLLLKMATTQRKSWRHFWARRKLCNVHLGYRLIWKHPADYPLMSGIRHSSGGCICKGKSPGVWCNCGPCPSLLRKQTQPRQKTMCRTSLEWQLSKTLSP